MTTTNTNKNSPRHDRTAIREFLLHLAGELKRQQLAANGEPLPPKLHQGVLRFRSKYGTSLLPDLETPGGDLHSDAVRQAFINRRSEQVKLVMGVIELLGELTTSATEVMG